MKLDRGREEDKYSKVNGSRLFDFDNRKLLTLHERDWISPTCFFNIEMVNNFIRRGFQSFFSS